MDNVVYIGDVCMNRGRFLWGNERNWQFWDHRDSTYAARYYQRGSTVGT